MSPRRRLAQPPNTPSSGSSSTGRSPPSRPWAIGCADAYIDVEGIRLTLWQAIYSIEIGADATIDVQTAKFWAAEGGHRVAHAIVHLHGGMGIAKEYFIHRYFAFAKQIEFSLGAATEQAMLIGATLATEPV